MIMEIALGIILAVIPSAVFTVGLVSWFSDRGYSYWMIGMAWFMIFSLVLVYWVSA